MIYRPLAISLFLLLIATSTSCNKDTSDTTINGPDCKYGVDKYTLLNDPSYSDSGLIPMSMNNYWKYADSTWDASGTLVNSGEFILQPEEMGSFGNEVWWTTNFYPIGLIHVKNDCLFDMQNGLSQCSFESLSYKLFDDDSTSYTGSIWGDIAVVVDANKVNSVTTPAGTFTDCFNYKKYNYDETMIKPGIGILEWKSGFYDNSLEGRKLTLIEYNIQ